MATQTLATADAILKELYVGPIIEQLNFKTYMLDQVERDADSVDFTGRRAIFPVESAMNPARTSITDGGTLPTPGKESYADGIVNIRYHTAGFEITDQAIKQAKGDGAFVNLLQRGTQHVAKMMRKNLNRQVFGDGTGLLATVATASGPATTVTVDTTQYLKVGDPIDVLTRSNGATVSAGRTITAINRTTKVVTLDASVTVTLNEGFYLQGAYGLESDGLLNITAPNHTLHGIDSTVAGNEYWKGNEIAAATAPSTAVAGESLFEQLADQIGGQGQGDVKVFLSSRGIRRRLADTYQSVKRFNDAKAVDIHGGYTAIFVNEVPVVADDDSRKNYVFALPDVKEAFKWFEVSSPDWLKSSDGTVWQLAPGSVAGTRRAAWQAWFTWYAALGCLAPNRTGRITQATDDPN